MSSLGKHLRWLCLLGYISYEVYFLVRGTVMLKNEEGDMAGIFLCDSSSDEVMAKCSGLDDTSTCGWGVECVRSSCGRPLFPHVGVSYAGSSDPFDQSAATSTQSLATIVSLGYSLVPYLLTIFFVVRFLAMGNVAPLTRLGLMGFAVLVNDVALKNLLNEPRPTGSCLYFHSHGMPSGHAATSIGLLTFILLELLLYHPDLVGKRCNTAELEDVGLPSDDRFMFGYGWHKRGIAMEGNNLEASILSSESPVVEEDGMPRTISLPPATDSVELPTERDISDSASYNTVEIQRQRFRLQSKWFHHYHALLWTAILMPVPWSRVHLHDHSALQVLVGSLVGMTLGNFWFFCIIRGAVCRPGAFNSKRCMERTVNSRFGKWFGLNVG